MAFQFKLPDIGEGIAEGEIVKWLSKRNRQLLNRRKAVNFIFRKERL